MSRPALEARHCAARCGKSWRALPNSPNWFCCHAHMTEGRSGIHGEEAKAKAAEQSAQTLLPMRWNEKPGKGRPQVSAAGGMNDDWDERREDPLADTVTNKFHHKQGDGFVKALEREVGVKVKGDSWDSN